MKVPILENQSVPEQPTLLQTPQISKGIPGAFGEAPAEATEKLGEAGVHAGTALLQHIEWQNYQKSMDKVYEAHAHRCLNEKSPKRLEYSTPCKTV